MTYCLQPEVAISINAAFPSGGVLLDRATLEGALARPMHGLGDREFYPSVVEKAGALLQALAQRQVFRDANKRTAWTCCTTFLDLHGLVIVDVTQDEVVEFVVEVATDSIHLDEITLWLLDRTVSA